MENTKNKPRVLITYIESGMGHIMSAKAVSDGLKENFSDRIEVVETQIMRDSNSKEQIRFEKFLTNQTKATNKYKFYAPVVFTIMNIGKQKFMRFLHHTIFKKATDATVEALRSFNADVIVSTHYFITFCAIELKRRYQPDLLVACYNPDNNVHVWWDNRSDLFITNNKIAAEEAVEKRNFDKNSVKTVFFLAREQVVKANGSKEDYRLKYGIDKDSFTVMIADGAYASAKAKSYCNALLKENLDITIIMLAGKNEKVKKYFEKKQKKPLGRTKLQVYGFTEKAYELYGASDVFITKAGPNAVLDCLFMKTPVIISCCPHPIEKATKELFVDSFGCGVSAFDKKTAAELVKKYSADPSLLNEFRDNINKNLDKNNNGAYAVGNIIIDALKDKNKL